GTGEHPRPDSSRHQQYDDRPREDCLSFDKLRPAGVAKQRGISTHVNAETVQELPVRSADLFYVKTRIRSNVIKRSIHEIAVARVYCRRHTIAVCIVANGSCPHSVFWARSCIERFAYVCIKSPDAVCNSFTQQQ